MSSLATPWLVVVFVAGAGATWLAGSSLSKTTDALDFRLGLGEELGGILLLAVAGNFVFPFLDACFTLGFIPGVALAATGNFAIVGPMTLLVLPLNAVLGGVMFMHQRHVFSTVNLRVRKNGIGLLFYFFCYQFVMSPISIGGYLLETVRARRAW